MVSLRAHNELVLVVRVGVRRQAGVLKSDKSLETHILTATSHLPCMFRLSSRLLLQGRSSHHTSAVTDPQRTRDSVTLCTFTICRM